MTFLKKLKKPVIEDIEKAREEFIEKAEQKSNGEIKKKKEWEKILLRIPIEDLEKIDLLVKDKKIITRTTWILEAIRKELRDVKNGK